jgi:hypothetical protein
MSDLSSMFLQHAKAKAYQFECALTCTVGNYLLSTGDKLEAVEAGNGFYWLYVEWEKESSLARLPANSINTLAGKEIIPAAHYVGSSHATN